MTRIAPQGCAAVSGHILVDEYQDTNLVQARDCAPVAATPDGKCGNIMVVGDEAQSIYAFRGANVRNIPRISIPVSGLPHNPP